MAHARRMSLSTAIALLVLISTGCHFGGRYDPEVTIMAGPAVTEGTAAEFTVTATPAPAADLEVGVEVSKSGAMVADSSPRTVTIMAGASEATLSVETVSTTRRMSSPAR